jgi:hypothetical protein
MVPSGTVSLVPSILSPLDQGGWTVSKNANHYKTCNFLYLYGLNRWLKKVAGVDLSTNNVRK